MTDNIMNETKFNFVQHFVYLMAFSMKLLIQKSTANFSVLWRDHNSMADVTFSCLICVGRKCSDLAYNDNTLPKVIHVHQPAG